MKKILFLLLIFSFVWGSEKEMMHELEVVKHAIETKYAPKRWKSELFGWNLEKSYLKAKKEVTNAKTVKDFQKIVKNLLHSTRDYHVGVRFFSTATSWFPLVVKEVEGRYYVTNDTARMPENFIENKIEMGEFENGKELLGDIHAGDEVIAIDGKPVRQLVEEIIDEYRGGDRTPTGYSVGTRMLFNRQAEMPGTFTLTVVRDGETMEREFKWAKIPEWIKDHPITPKQAPIFDEEFSIERRGRSKTSEKLHPFFRKDYSVEFIKPLLFSDEEQAKTEESDGKDKRKKGFLPPLGEIIWETEGKGTLYAYLYKTPSGKKIGYLSITSYALIPMMKEVEEAIAYLEKESDALVIDQMNNAGGYLHFTYGILSLLTDKPLAGLSQRETLIQEDMMEYAEAGMRFPKILEKPEKPDELPNVEGFVIRQEVVDQLQGHLARVFETWESGRRYTDLLPMFGMDLIYPHPKVNYTKPILVLINELDFSCAELFPAILKDNGRATLMGKTTAGAGGYVRSYQHLSRFGIASINLTGSIVVRSNGQIIENLGVSPDVPYNLTVRDMKEDYADFIERVNKEVESLI